MNIAEILGSTISQHLTSIAKEDLQTRLIAAGLNQNFSLQQASIRIQTIEEPHQEKLQQLAKTWIYEAFQANESDIKLSASLVSPQEIPHHPEQLIQANPLALATFLPANPITPEIELEIKKRRLINFLIAGAGHSCQNIYMLKDDQLDQINPDLALNYKKVMPFAESLYWAINPQMLKEMQKHTPPAGIVNLENDSSGGTSVNAAGVVLPVLLLELGKGMMQAIARHGLPADSDTRQIVKAHADRLDYEIEETKLGKSLYQALIRSRTDTEKKLPLANFLHQVVKLPAEEFITKIQSSFK